MPAALFRGNVVHTANLSCERSALFSVPSYGDGTRLEPGPSPCYRVSLVDRLQGRPRFDVGGSQHLAEEEWEGWKLLLVIGNSLGWADRLMASLFKDSVTVLVDAVC